MIELADAPGHVVVISTSHVQLLDPVEHVLTELDVVGGRIAAFIFVCRNVNAMSFQVAETIPGDCDVRPFAFDDFDAPVVFTRADLAPVPPPIHIIQCASRMGRHALVTDQPIFQASLEALY